MARFTPAQRAERLAHATVPPASCRDCDGDGRRWNAARDRFETRPCASCKGSGEERAK